MRLSPIFAVAGSSPLLESFLESANIGDECLALVGPERLFKWGHLFFALHYHLKELVVGHLLNLR
jgi:hypothetical protein